MNKRTLRYAVAGTAAVSTALIVAACGGSSSYGVGWPYLIAVPGVDSTNTYSFDLGVVDNATGRYYVTDRTTKSVDVVDIASKVVIGQFGGSMFGCALYDGVTETTAPGCNAINGVAANNDTSGPDGIDIVGQNLYVGDVGKLWVLDKTTGAVVTTIAIPSTNGTGKKAVRADEGCFDSADNIYAISTPGDDAPFMTFIDTTNNKVIYKLVMNDAGGPSAGLEACVYDPVSKRIYVNNDGSTPNDHGEMDGIPMATIVGLKGGEVASNATLGAYPNNGATAWTTIVPTGTAWAFIRTPAAPANPTDSCDPTGIALGKATATGSEIGFMCRPGQVGNVLYFGVIDSGTGTLMYRINAGGGDQITYNATTNKWYLADSRWTPAGTSCGSGSATCNLTPVLAEVDGTSHAVIARIPTGNNAHSVAAGSGYVFSPYNKFTSVNTGGSLVSNTGNGGGGIEMNPM